MGPLSSKLCKKQSNTDILIYLLYLSNLYENILKTIDLLYSKKWPLASNTTPDDFGISFKPFRRLPSLNWEMLPLSLPSIYHWCCMVFCWPLTQPRPTHNNQKDSNLEI